MFTLSEEQFEVFVEEVEFACSISASEEEIVIDREEDVFDQVAFFPDGGVEERRSGDGQVWDHRELISA